MALRPLYTFFIALFLLSSLYAGSNQKSVDYLNHIRVNAGLTKLQINDTLNSAAASHAKYLIVNQLHGHYEKREHYAFTGETPSERVLAAGYPTTYVMENLSINPESEEKSIDNLFSAIYHRFVFLDFDKDEIGIGSYTSEKKRRKQFAYVYNLGYSAIAQYCTKSYVIKSGQFYIKGLCKDPDKMLPNALVEESKEQIRLKNNRVILYPYNGQNNIWPAFYRESPDPLPYYDVSGFPVSVQFNPSYYKEIELISFKLFNQSGEEVKKTKILEHSNDLNGLFTPYQFALMPLERLDFASTYTVEFSALADGRKLHKKWSFETTKLKEKLYTITENHTNIRLKPSQEVVIYLVPTSKKNIIHSYKIRGSMDVTFLDQNTLKVTAPSKPNKRDIILDFGRRKVSFRVH